METFAVADFGVVADSALATVLLVEGFGVWGSGVERGESILLPSPFAELLVGVEVADVGVFVFSASSGFVVLICAGVGFFAAAIFAASAPSWRIARFCAELGCATFSFLVVAVVVVAAGAAIEGFAGMGVKVDATPSASLSSSYSFHSSISSMPYATRKHTVP